MSAATFISLLTSADAVIEAADELIEMPIRGTYARGGQQKLADRVADINVLMVQIWETLDEAWSEARRQGLGVTEPVVHDHSLYSARNFSLQMKAATPELNWLKQHIEMSELGNIDLVGGWRRRLNFDTHPGLCFSLAFGLPMLLLMIVIFG